MHTPTAAEPGPRCYPLPEPRVRRDGVDTLAPCSTRRDLGFIETESAAAAATISPASLDARVPSCPDWSLTELIWHLGRVQRFWATTVHAGELDPEFPAEETGPSDAKELDAWFRTSTRELLDALHAVPWDTPAWTWWKEDRTVGAIARHQVQEAAVHRWDAQLAVGHPDPLPTKLADDGVDEFLWIARQMRGPEPIAFHATDTGSTFAAGRASRSSRCRRRHRISCCCSTGGSLLTE